MILFPACSTVPETGRKQMILMSPEEENSAGLTTFQKIKSSMKISGNSSRQAQVQRIGRKIANVTPMRNAQWEFIVFDDPDPNAFCLPGGKVGVQTGIFKVATNEAELAAVLSHEIGHAIARHSAEQASQNQILGLGVGVIGTAVSIGSSVATNGGFAPDAGTVSDVLGTGATLGMLLPFSRKQESEADQLGLIYMARAGYDPHAAVTFWKRMASYRKSAGEKETPAFLSTHPVDETRITRLEKAMPYALEEYRKATGR